MKLPAALLTTLALAVATTGCDERKSNPNSADPQAKKVQTPGEGCNPDGECPVPDNGGDSCPACGRG